ncbi:MAG: MaoC family dehydratase N-terminal domain-containing protein [Promethearchaeota archaeon]
MDSKQITKNAEFLIKTLPGKKIEGSATIKCRYKNLVSLAKLYGKKDAKYIGPEEEGIIAIHAWANVYAIKTLYTLVIGIKLIQDGVERQFLLNTSKMLHAGNVYDWEGCVDVKSGDKLTGTARWGDIWYVEKNQMLFGNLHATIKNQNDELVCKITSRIGIRPGGY